MFNVQQLADPSQKLLDLYNFFPDADKRLRQPGMTLLSVYNETLTRRDFIDPFLKTLGWDIENESGFAEAYRCLSPFPAINNSIRLNRI